LNLIPEDIGLIIGFSPHETEFAIGDRAVAMINETLLGKGNIVIARYHDQQNDNPADQQFGDNTIHSDQGRHGLDSLDCCV
jgi:hypothetical protein